MTWIAGIALVKKLSEQFDQDATIPAYLLPVFDRFSIGR
jgi:hypothetical protein